MKPSLFSSLFVICISVATIVNATCPGATANGFIFLKEWKVESNEYERSYVFTANTSYMFSFCSTPDPSGELIVQDSGRNTLMQVKTSTGSIEWKAMSTGIVYVKFKNLEHETAALSFKKH